MIENAVDYRALFKGRNMYFTLPHNNPSGGVKVVNEFVLLLRSKNISSYLCLPKHNLASATFLEVPAPVIALDEMAQRSTSKDIIISCWQSTWEFDAVKRSKAYKKIFWQHGILIPTIRDSVAEKVYEKGVFDIYWNVSHVCGDYIKNKYNLPNMHVVNPFFETKKINVDETAERHGCIVLERRGSEVIPRLKKHLRQIGESLTVLSPPFRNSHFLNLLRNHKLFVSIDNGLEQSSRFDLSSIVKKKKWVRHDKNYCGFPMPPIEAAQAGCIVAGYSMGGGREWMNSSNCILAGDGDEDALFRGVERAFNLTKQEMTDMIDNARVSVGKFSPENSLTQIIGGVFEK